MPVHGRHSATASRVWAEACCGHGRHLPGVHRADPMRAGPNADVPLYCVSDTPRGNDPQRWGLRNATKEYTGKPGATYGSTRPV